VARTEKSGIRALSHHELRELALLYRQTASDLSTIREDPSSQRLAHSLNQLLGRAHNCIYMGRRAQASRIVTFYRDNFPQVFHETLPYTLAACAVFFALAAGRELKGDSTSVNLVEAIPQPFRNHWSISLR
jgi:hypothetical protein